MNKNVTQSLRNKQAYKLVHTAYNTLKSWQRVSDWFGGVYSKRSYHRFMHGGTIPAAHVDHILATGAASITASDRPSARPGRTTIHLSTDVAKAFRELRDMTQQSNDETLSQLLDLVKQ